MNVLVVYGTTDGQTAAIAERIAAQLRAHGALVTCVDAREAPDPLDPSSYDAVIAGGSVHIGGYQLRLKRWLARNRPAITLHASAFFSVCMAIASKDGRSRKEALETPQKFVNALEWDPEDIAVFAGALRFSRYGFVRRAIMKSIARKEMDVVDTSRDYVFTDWDAVDRFADRVLSRLPRRMPEERTREA